MYGVVLQIDEEKKKASDITDQLKACVAACQSIDNAVTGTKEMYHALCDATECFDQLVKQATSAAEYGLTVQVGRRCILSSPFLAVALRVDGWQGRLTDWLV